MGANSSKSEAHVWRGSSPTSVSHDLVENLQSSKEVRLTDTSRQQLADLQHEARLARALTAQMADEHRKLSQMRENLPPSPTDNDNPSRQSVQHEVDALRSRLEAFNNVQKPLPEDVSRARGEVVRCLRENDRRPLDCWREVEAFKREVRRLESGWVNKVVG